MNETTQLFRKFGAGRGSDTKGAAARNSRPTLRQVIDEIVGGVLTAARRYALPVVAKS